MIHTCIIYIFVDGKKIITLITSDNVMTGFYGFPGRTHPGSLRSPQKPCCAWRKELLQLGSQPSQHCVVHVFSHAGKLNPTKGTVSPGSRARFKIESTPAARNMELKALVKMNLRDSENKGVAL